MSARAGMIFAMCSRVALSRRKMSNSKWRTALESLRNDRTQEHPSRISKHLAPIGAAACSAKKLTLVRQCIYLLIHDLFIIVRGIGSVAKTATLKVQQWGNSLAVRIPAAVARSARFVAGQPVELSVGEDGVLVKIAGKPKSTLAQKLAAFDPGRHGGEAMATGAVGVEVL